MAFYLTSDQHYFHLRALEIMPFRPWSTIEEMNEGLIANHNSVVKPEDTCIHLGDLVMGKKFENVPKIIPRLNGKHILIPGNHCFLPSELKPEKLQAMEDLYLNNGIVEIAYGCVGLDRFTRDSNDFNIKLCHFPTLTIPDHADQYEQRYKSLHPTLAPGDWLLHGHIHSRAHITGPNLIHVGVDAEAWNYRPVSFDTILGIVNK